MRIVVLSIAFVAAVFAKGQDLQPGTLESCLWHRLIPQDDLVNEPEPEQRDGWEIDALPDFLGMMRAWGITTNELVSSIIQCATTNNAQWTSGTSLNRQLGYAAIKALTEINHPAATAYLKDYCRGGTAPCYCEAIVGTFRYSSLDALTTAYLKERCAETNVYGQVAHNVLWEMKKTLDTLPLGERPGAWTNFTAYAYYSMAHTSSGYKGQEEMLVSVLPDYTNSVQRLLMAQQIARSTTSNKTRAFATNIVTRLTAIPPEQRVDLPWLEGM